MSSASGCEQKALRIAKNSSLLKQFVEAVFGHPFLIANCTLIFIFPLTTCEIIANAPILPEMGLARGHLKMWQLSVLSRLIWTNVCYAMLRQGRDANPLVFRDEAYATIPETSAPSFASNNEARGYPWIVDVTILFGNTDQLSTWSPQYDDEIFACGGSLIHKNVVLTAAHCVNDYKRLDQGRIIIVGSTKWQNTEEYPRQEKLASRIIVHEDYDQNNHHRNNFALIILSEPFEIAPNFDILRIQQESDQVDGSRCVSSVVVNTERNDGRWRRIYKETQFRIIANDECQDYLRKTEHDSTIELHSSFMCASSTDKNNTRPCTGVGGAPLACPLLYDSSNYVQVGVIGWAYGCTEYAVHPNVAAVRDWIEEIVKSNTLREDSFQQTYTRPSRGEGEGTLPERDQSLSRPLFREFSNVRDMIYNFRESSLNPVRRHPLPNLYIHPVIH